MPRLLDSLTWGDVVAIAPHLASAPLELQDLVLEAVPLRVEQDRWGDPAFMAGLQLAAHLATVSTQGGKSGPVSSQAVGQVSVSYGLPSSWEEGLALTSYGREYIRLRRQALGFVGFAC